MKARHVIIAAMWTNLLAVSATAETTVVRPDGCAAPANLPKLVQFLDVSADDLNPDAHIADNVVVVYLAPERGWASARVLSHFDIEGEPKRARRARAGNC